jgi:hypothetical protein
MSRSRATRRKPERVPQHHLDIDALAWASRTETYRLAQSNDPARQLLWLFTSRNRKTTSGSRPLVLLDFRDGLAWSWRSVRIRSPHTEPDALQDSYSSPDGQALPFI